ncbi:hypothetical protein QBC43DRAFT_322792 [Cladorrhinum sp. PSN259]|nr:hypothetical protein QBC43DRAFT_322792 [Cladorrhinum sp. PSN259]
MSLPWIFLCPSTRGISHALLSHLLQTTHPSIPILCTHRPESKPPSLPSSSHQPGSDGRRIHTIPLDVTSPDTISQAAQEASRLFPKSTHHLHLSFALPGILLNPERSSRQIDAVASLKTFQTNTLGPLLLIKHFSQFLPSRSTTTLEDVPGLPRQAIWTCMSARVGSTSDNKLGGWYSYRASKAAVNSIVKTFDVELKQKSGEAAMAVGYHPGTVKTDLSKDFWGGRDMFTPEEAAEKMAGVIMGLDLEKRGRCWDWKGEEILP